MNQCVFTGRLVRDPELALVNGVAHTRFSLALRRDYKNRDGEYDADFVDLEAWRQQAEYITSYGHQGDLAEAVCSARSEPYEKDGQKKTKRYFDCRNIRILSHVQGGDFSPEEEDGFDFGDDFEET